MAALATKEVDFYDNPGRVNDRDSTGCTTLAAAVWKDTHSLVVWLLDEKDANVNATTQEGKTPLHLAATPDIVAALLDRGGDPARVNRQKLSPLMWGAKLRRHAEVVARLLQDPRVRAIINMQDGEGDTALHSVCSFSNNATAACKAQLFLHPMVTNNKGNTPLGVVRLHHPIYHALIALFEQYPEAKKDAEKAALLVKARRLAVAATSNNVSPSCLQARLAGGQPLPVVGLMPLTDGQVDGEDEHGEEDRKLRTTLAFLTGLGREAIPRDVFRIVVDLLMPSWDPLRRKDAGAGEPLGQG